MKNGGHDHIDDDLKELARELGIDIDKLIDDSKRIEERKKELEALKKKNQDNLANLKRRGSKLFSKPPSSLNSKNNSRRGSRLNSDLGALGNIGSAYKH
jgi:hypothetical protein